MSASTFTFRAHRECNGKSKETVKHVHALGQSKKNTLPSWTRLPMRQHAEQELMHKTLLPGLPEEERSWRKSRPKLPKASLFTKLKLPKGECNLYKKAGLPHLQSDELPGRCLHTSAYVLLTSVFGLSLIELQDITGLPQRIATVRLDSGGAPVGFRKMSLFGIHLFGVSFFFSQARIGSIS